MLYKQVYLISPAINIFAPISATLTIPSLSSILAKPVDTPIAQPLSYLS